MEDMTNVALTKKSVWVLAKMREGEKESVREG